jgi:3-oxoacyl-[acyl-carrier-protein] synthase III
MNETSIGLQILGSGEFAPRRTVSSEVIDQRLGRPSGWTSRHTGVTSRAFAENGEDVLTMGVGAARQALAAAGIAPEELDAVVAVGSVPIQAIPCTAVFLQQALGLVEQGVPAFDVNATCLGFLVALDLIAQAIATGRFGHVLIVASELASAGINPDDPLTAGLFGDGAGAVIVGPAKRQSSRLLATELQTYPEGAEYCQVRAGGSRLHPRHDLEAFLGGTYFEMAGKPTYRLAAERYPSFLESLFRRARVRSQDIDVWVPHQASGKAIEHLMDALDVPRDRLVLTLPTHGNQISASIPVALHVAINEGRITPGCLVALVGSGAGLSFGGAILRY